MLKILFWLLASIVLYTYVGYAAVITLLAKIIKNPVKRDDKSRFISLIIAAYNEETVIEAKIKNSLELDYPADKLEIILVTDGSNDRTVELASKFASERVKIYHSDLRQGKMAALKRVLPMTEGEIVVFSDANAFYNPAALCYLAKPFADSQVGCVAGEKRVVAHLQTKKVASAEGLYWRYESYLKRKDSQVYSATGAAGEIYAVRRDLLELPPNNALLDDFMVSMLIAKRGYRIIYEPLAQATEVEGASLKDDWTRRVRIASGGFQSIWLLRGLLKPKHGIFWFQYFSHRVLRWAGAPLALLGLIGVNLLLLKKPFFRIIMGLQTVFYLLSLAGITATSKGYRIRGLAVPGDFVIMNLAAVVGLYRYLTRTQSVIWKKADRSSFFQPVGPGGLGAATDGSKQPVEYEATASLRPVKEHPGPA